MVWISIEGAEMEITWMRSNYSNFLFQMPQKPRQQIPITSIWNRMIDFIEWPVKIVRCDNTRKIEAINHNQLRSLHGIYIDYKYTHSIRCKIGDGAQFVVVKVIVDISLFRLDAPILMHGLKLNNMRAIWLTYSIFDRESARILTANLDAIMQTLNAFLSQLWMAQLYMWDIKLC